MLFLRRGGLSVVALLTFLSYACSGEQRAAGSITPGAGSSLVVASPAVTSELCKGGAVKLSPQERYLYSEIYARSSPAVPIQHSSGVAIMRRACSSGSDGKPCGILVEALEGMRLLGWSAKEDRAFAISGFEGGQAELLEIDLATGKMRPVDLDLSAFDMDVLRRLVLTGPIESDKEIGALLRHTRDGIDPRTGNLPRKFIWTGQTRNVLIEEAGTTDLQVWSGTSRIFNTGLPSGYLRDPVIRLGIPEQESPILSDTGLEVELGGTTGHEQPFLRWAGSPTQQRHWAKWRADKIELAPATRLGLGREMVETGNFVSVDVGSKGSVVALRQVPSSGARELTLITGAGSRRLCSAPAPDRARSVGKVELAELSGGGRPLFGWIIHPTGPTRGIAYYFGGGPLGGIDNPLLGVSPALETLLNNGFKVVTVNYSGSSFTGAAIANRLAGEGLAAFETDANLIAADIKQRASRQNMPLIIVGSSFGSTMALTVESKSAPTVGVALFAPLLKIRDPSSWISNEDKARYQATFENRTIFKAVSRAEFNRNLAKLMSARRSDRPVFLAFANNDPVSLPADWSAPLGASSRVIHSRFGHDIIEGDAGVVAALEAWVENGSKPIRPDGPARSR